MTFARLIGRWNKKIHTKLNCASDEGGKSGRVVRQARILGISSQKVCYSGILFVKRKIYPGGRQSYAVT